MNKLLLIFLGFYSITSFADDDRVGAKVTKVTVFQRQAQITSIAKGFSKNGNYTLILENVSPWLDPQSIQITGKGDLLLFGTKFSNNFEKQGKNSPKLTQLNDSLRTLNEDLRLFSLNQETLEREKDLLKANYLTGATTIANTADKVKAMADFFRLRMGDINANILKNERITNLNKEKMVRIQSQIKELNERGNIPSGEISINISSKSRTPFDLEITYIVPNSGWSPMYDVRVKDTKSAISLVYKANVWQQSGIDWNDVKLTLSTLNPSQGGNKPELIPQMVDIYVQPVLMQNVPNPMYRSKAMDAPMMDAMPVGAAMNEVVTVGNVMTENTLAVNFEVDLPYTITSGGKPEMVEIQKNELPATYRHFGVPKYDTDAFLTADVLGWDQYNLLPGKANIYLEGAYVGEIMMANNITSDTLNLSLGRDKKINIKREIIKDFSAKKTIGANIRETKAFRITVRNTKKENIDLVLEDQIPISKNSDVEILDVEYKGAELNSETGKLTWKINLKPSETKVVEVKYIVKYPKGKIIIGL